MTLYSKTDITDLASPAVLRTTGNEVEYLKLHVSLTKADEAEIWVANNDDSFTTKYPAGGKVEVYVNTTSPATTKRFTGIIEKQERYTEGSRKYMKLFCREKFHAVAIERMVAETYANKEISTIVTDLVGKYGTDITAGAQVDVTSVTLKDIELRYKPLSDCLDLLADMAGFMWWIDPAGILYFKKKLNVDSGITVTEAEAKPIPRIADDLLPSKNTVIVIGGWDVKVDQEQTTTAGGPAALDALFIAVKFTPTQTLLKKIRVNLDKQGSPQNLFGKIVQDNNNAPTGPDRGYFQFQRADVGAQAWYEAHVVAELDTAKSYWLILNKTGDATNRYRWFHDASAVNSHAESTDGSSWTIVGSSYKPSFGVYYGAQIIAKASDEVSISTYGARELVIVDSSITDSAVARKIALAKLDEFTGVKKRIESIVVDNPTTIPNPGDLVRINFSTLSFDKKLAVEEMIITWPGGLSGAESYELVLGNPGGSSTINLEQTIAQIQRELRDERTKELDLAKTALALIKQYFESLSLSDAQTIMEPGHARHPQYLESLSPTEVITKTEKNTGTFVWDTMKWELSDWN